MNTVKNITCDMIFIVHSLREVIIFTLSIK